MKYIKSFENKKLKYNIGDYIYVVGYPNISYNFAKISGINKFVKAYGTWDYLINFIDDDGIYHDGIFGTYIDESDIRRKLTDNEILKFESIISSLKYNL